MRKFCLFLALSAAIAFPAAAQNTDIESLSGLTFNFGNPGARSLGMGGAFLGLADDASAAEANPSGLTVLRRPEVSVEVRNYQVRSVTVGQDAQGEAHVEAEHGGKMFRGRAFSTDIIEASALAFLQVINRIALRQVAGDRIRATEPPPREQIA